MEVFSSEVSDLEATHVAFHDFLQLVSLLFFQMGLRVPLECQRRHSQRLERKLCVTLKEKGGRERGDVSLVVLNLFLLRNFLGLSYAITVFP